MKGKRTILFIGLIASFSVPVGSFSSPTKDDSITEHARKVHFSSIVLDTHIDVTPKLQTTWKFNEEHKDGHIDLPRMKKGGLNALFFSIYMSGTVTGPKAVNDSIERIAAVHRLAAEMPDQVALCVTADQVRRAHKQGKIAALMGMEGGHMINNSLAVLRMYAELGVRYLTLTHSVNTDWADSSGDQPKHNGLTDFGKDVVRELNRLGVMVDISHVSDKTFWDAIEVSKAPMLASHSSCRAISGHARNMTDDMIKALAAKGGVIQINYLDQFIDNELFKYSQKSQPLMRELQQTYPGRENAAKRREEVAKQFGPRPEGKLGKDHRAYRSRGEACRRRSRRAGFRLRRREHAGGHGRLHLSPKNHRGPDAKRIFRFRHAENTRAEYVAIT